MISMVQFPEAEPVFFPRIAHSRARESILWADNAAHTR